MNTHADKTKDVQSQPVANSLTTKQSTQQDGTYFEDNRPETIQQKKLQQAISLKNTSLTNALAPVQRVPKTVEIVWNTTHVVRKMDGSIFGKEGFEEGEIGAEGELMKGQRIIIEDEDIFISRRSSNQESQEKRSADESSEPSVPWYRVLFLNGRDVSGQQLYVRKETFREYKGELTAEESASQKSANVYWIANIVHALLHGLKYRTGGSFAAKMEYNSERTPKDIDLEFWSYEAALEAAARLEAYKGNPKDTQFPRLEYFLIEKEKNVSVTALAMGFSNKNDKRPMQIVTIELNNENYRQSSRDFTHLPDTRHEQQPPRLRAGSIIANSLERLSYTLLSGEKDDKQDEKFLRHIISTIKDKDPEEIYKDVISRFDKERIISAPVPVVKSKSKKDSESDESDSEDEQYDHKKRLKILEGKLKELLGLG